MKKMTETEKAAVTRLARLFTAWVICTGRAIKNGNTADKQDALTGAADIVDAINDMADEEDAIGKRVRW